MLAGQFAIKLEIKDVIEWNDISGDSLSSLLSQLEHKMKEVEDSFVIGIKLDKNLAKYWYRTNEIGFTQVLGNFLVVKDIPSFPGVTDWDYLQEAILLAHEIGHSFGAPHILDPTSIMYPTTEYFGFKFDQFSKSIIDLSKGNVLNIDSADQFLNLMNSIILQYETISDLNIEFLPYVAGLISKYSQKFGPLNEKDIQFADSSIFYAIKGYNYYIEEKWIEAKEVFLKAIELNSERFEPFLYLGLIYEHFNQIKASDRYFKLAKEKAYPLPGKD